MSIVSFGRGYLSTTPFDKTAWLNRVCRERADGSEFVASPTGPTAAQHVRLLWRGRWGEVQDVGCRSKDGESCASDTLHLFSRAQGGLEIKSRCFRPESVVEAHVIYTLHQRTPEVLVLQP